MFPGATPRKGKAISRNRILSALPGLLLNAYFVLALQPAEGQRQSKATFIVEIGETHLAELMRTAFITDTIRKA